MFADPVCFWKKNDFRLASCFIDREDIALKDTKIIWQNKVNDNSIFPSMALAFFCQIMLKILALTLFYQMFLLNQMDLLCFTIPISPASIDGDMNVCSKERSLYK